MKGLFRRGAAAAVAGMGRWGGESAAIAGAVARLLYPASCLFCGEPDQVAPICGACRERFRAEPLPACPRCAMPIGPNADVTGGCSECRGRVLGFDAAFCLGIYEGPLRRSCLELKRPAGAWLARWLADLLVVAHGSDFRAQRVDLVVPIPLHWSRRILRGYNQSEELARGVARGLGLPVRAALRRPKRTPRLAGLGRSQRDLALRGAFATGRGVDLAGRTILVIDDILTTGATCGAAARALKRAGAARVLVAVLARALGTTP